MQWLKHGRDGLVWLWIKRVCQIVDFLRGVAHSYLVIAVLKVSIGKVSSVAELATNALIIVCDLIQGVSCCLSVYNELV